MLDQVDWKTVAADLDEVGMASTGKVLRPAQCRALPKCGLPSGRISCRSPGTGRNGSANPMPGPTPSRSGWSSATAPGRGVPLPCCCAMARADGTHYIVTSSVVGRFAAARGERAAFRQAHHARPHLPRRGLMARRRASCRQERRSCGAAACYQCRSGTMQAAVGDE